MKKYSKFLSLVLALAMLLPGFVQPAEAAPVVENTFVTRLAGSTRIETAIAASKVAYDKADTVVLAGYNGEVDALTGTLLASKKNAPLLLTLKDEVPANVKAEITRLGAKNVYILGGETVVSKKAENSLTGLNVKRIGGLNRADTAMKIAKEVKGTNANHVFIARGYEDKLADALAIGPVSGMMNHPVFLTQTAKLPAETIQVLKDLKVKEVTVVGGDSAVNEDVVKQLETMNITVDRVSGDNREGTAVEIANKYFPNAKTSVIAYGWKYADALVGGYLGAKMNAPIILTNTNVLPPASKTFLENKQCNAWVLGGETVVSAKVFDQIKQLVNCEDGPEVPSDKADLKAYNAALAAVKQADYTSDSWKVYQAVVDANKVTEDDTQAVVNAATAAIVAAQKNLVKVETPVPGVKAEIESVKAENVNTLRVTFKNKVNPEEVALSLAKAGNKVETSTVEWDKDNKEVIITTVAKMSNGVYTVKAVSKDGSESTATIEIKNQEVSKIVILNKTALTNDNNKEAYVYYDVLDQYGKSIRTSSSIQWSSSVNVTDNKALGRLTLKRGDDKDFTYNEKVYITGVNIKTGVSVSEEVTIGAKQALNSVKVAGFVKKNTNTLLTTLPAGFKANEYYMAYTITDQNGNVIEREKPAANNDVTFISDNILLIRELVKGQEGKLVVNDTEYNTILVQPGINVNVGGEVTITAIANKTGNKSEYNVAIGSNFILKSFAMSSPSGIIADGESIVLPFVALDQNGEAIKNFTTLANQSEFNKLSFTTSQGTVKLRENNDGTASLVYYDNQAPAWSDSRSTDGIDRTVSVTAVVVGGNSDNLVLSVQDKARPEAILEVDMDEVMVERGAQRISLSSFDFLDQYGRKMARNYMYLNGNDGNITNKNGGNVYDNGFFEATGLNGLEFAGYDFSVRATFTGDNGYVAANTKALESKDVVKVDKGEDFNLSANANTVASSKSGFSFKYEIVRTKLADDFAKKSEAISTAKTKSLTIVDIKAVKGYTVGDIANIYVNTVKSNDLTGDTGVEKLDEKTITEAIEAGSIPAGHQKTVGVSGRFDGKVVKVPSIYFAINADKFTATGNKVTGVNASAIKWSDLYDAKTARYTRKLGEDTLKVAIKDLDNKEEVIDTVSKNVKFSDEAPKASDIVYGAEEVIAYPNTTVISSPVQDRFAILADDYGAEYYEVHDQYGVRFSDSKVTFKIANVVENKSGYTDNNFIVRGNDTNKANIAGAERGDTFELTIIADKATKKIKVTVGADAQANITNSKNNYVDVLLPALVKTPEIDGGTVTPPVTEVEKVQTAITKLSDTGNLVVGDKAAVESARKAYNALTETEKAKVTNLAILEAAEAKIKELEKVEADKTAAKTVTDLITNLKADATEAEVKAVEDALTALTADQKALVSDANKAVLTAARTRVNNEKAAAAVTKLITELPDAADVKATDKDHIDAARAAYKALNADQQALVNITRLEAAEVALNKVLKVLEGTILQEGPAGKEISVKLKDNSALEGVKIGGKLVSADYYEFKGESLSIYKTPEFAETDEIVIVLTDGEYTVKVVK